MSDHNLKTITVQGRSKVSCKPDTVGISFNLSSKNDNYSAAYDGLNQQVSLLRSQLEKLGLKKDQLKTRSFNISIKTKLVGDEEDEEDEEYVFDGYLASHSLSIELPIDKEQVNRILNTIAKSGLVSNISIYFLVSEADSYRDMAISTAVEKAKHNAELISRAANVKLGEITHINYGWSEVVFRRESVRLECSESSVFSSSPDIEPGDIDIAESVSLVYSIS